MGRTLLGRTLLGLAGALAALAIAGPAGAATTRTVNIYGSGFSPYSTTITAGDTVVWRNRDNAKHQVLAYSGSFVSPILSAGQSYSFTFYNAGTYHFSDELHSKLTGVIYVKAPPPTLTFAPTAQNVTYGQHITVGGVISSHAAGQQVTIWYQPYGQVSPIEKATVLTVSGGVYSLDVVPAIQTTYEAEWDNVFSAQSTVGVAPRIDIGHDVKWIVHVRGGRTFAGRGIQIQRLSVATGQWVTVRRCELDAGSSARVSLSLPKGMNHLRVTFSVNQAGAGFLGTRSAVVNWRVR